MILSAQTIRALCEGDRPMIAPFVGEKTLSPSGKSFGLSACSYDIRIAQGLILMPGEFSLASTVERFDMPHDVAGFVTDKSTFARLGVSAFNTLLDPGWRGTLTLELFNTTREAVVYEAGDPVAQIVFHCLDRPTERAYQGKYMDQPARPVGAIEERPDGSRIERT